MSTEVLCQKISQTGSHFLWFFGESLCERKILACNSQMTSKMKHLKCHKCGQEWLKHTYVLCR